MSLPPWLEPLPGAAAMRATDAWAIEERGIPGLELMESAGAALAECAALMAPDGRVAVLCGKGNNGGDGLVVARLLRERGRDVVVVDAGGVRESRGDAAANLARLPGDGPVSVADARLDDAALCVDCVLGTGASGAPRGDALAAIEALAGRRVLACDVPSGVDASTGEVAGAAVRAERTLTFHAAKPGLWVHPGKAHAGVVEVADIGIPDGAPREVHAGLIGRDVLREHRPRGADGTKFASGHVLVAGGAPGMTGAPTLACLGAMRAGAGYVTACVPEAVQPVLAVKLTEAMTLGLPDDPAAARDAVLGKAQRGGALVVGPGLGREDAAQQVARDLAARADVPLVLDADGLNAHAGRLHHLQARSAPAVLTPHAGELARLLETDGDAVGAARLAHARRAAELSGAVVVLKGDDTVVADPSGTVGVSRGGSPALATAGTGDVLAGVVAAFLARGTAPFAAACAAVLVHAEAGRLAARDLGVEGVVAGDVALRLGRAIRGG